jgi:O-antigen/teichoic acid export membrane protein
VLKFLGLSALPAFVNYNLTHILIARGQQLFSSVFVGAMLVLHVVLTWTLIPALGALAPALSVTFAELILLLCCTATLLLTGTKIREQRIADAVTLYE